MNRVWLPKRDWEILAGLMGADKGPLSGFQDLRIGTTEFHWKGKPSQIDFYLSPALSKAKNEFMMAVMMEAERAWEPVRDKATWIMGVARNKKGKRP